MKKTILAGFAMLFLLMVPFLIHAEGLVPCGGEGQPECTLCHLFVMFNNIVKLVMINIVPPLAALMLLFGGVLYYLGGISPAALRRANTTITSVVIGLIIIYCAWIIIDALLVGSGIVKTQTDSPLYKWWEIECETSGSSGQPGPEQNTTSGTADTGQDSVKVSSECDSGYEATGGSCEPGENSEVSSEGITSDGKGYYCDFEAIDPDGVSANGETTVDCIEEEEETYSDPNTSGDLVTKTKECEELDEIATGGECTPVDESKTLVTSQGISDDGKGYTCTFRGKSENVNLNTFYPPEVNISVDCIPDPDYVPPEDDGTETYEKTYSDTNTFGIPLKETLECEDTDQIATGGECIPGENTTLTGGNELSNVSEGWYCEFTGDYNSGGSQYSGFNYPPIGTIKVYCETETTAESNLIVTPIRSTDDFVANEVNSVPESQGIIGDDVYLVVPQEDTTIPATITLAYTDSQIAGLDEDTLAIYHYDEILSRWVGLPSAVDTVNNTVTASTSHFSIFAIMGNKTTATDCECTSGPCCDGCHYHPKIQACEYEADYLWSCSGDFPSTDPSDNCGNSVVVQTRLKYQFCSGESASCTGLWTDWGNWSNKKTYKSCDSTEYCVSGAGACEYSSFCASSLCECINGACCDGCYFLDTNQKCDAEIETDYGCPWGTDCGDDLGIRARKKDRYCSGSSGYCNGEWGDWGLWSNWEVEKSCNNTDICSAKDKSCLTTQFCEPNNDCDCAYGDCCEDNCYYSDSNEICDFDYKEGYGCPWGVDPGSDVGVRYHFKNQYCSGDSAECTGSWDDWDEGSEWKVEESCSLNQFCDAGSSSCENVFPEGCECTDEDDCCSDGCCYDSDGTVCLVGAYFTNQCISCEWDNEGECSYTSNGSFIRPIKTCNNKECSSVGYEEKPNSCVCVRETDGEACGELTATCKHSTIYCPNCPNNYCKKTLKYACIDGECNMSSTLWGECCNPDTPKECEPGTACCTDEGYYEEYAKICQEYDWSECTGGEYTSECDNMKIGSQSMKTMACDEQGNCNISSWDIYRDCVITRNTYGIPCDEGAGYCENGQCEHYSDMVCTPGTSCCDPDGQYKPEGTRCFTDYSWGTCITDWDQASDCQESITGTQYKNHKVCDAFGSCSVDDKETTTCTDTQDTDGDECGSAMLYSQHCKDGKCVKDESSFGGECDPFSTCCTTDGDYESEGARCETDISWSSCSDCDYHGSCDEKADGTKKKYHTSCDGSGLCTLLDVEENDCTCTRNTNGNKCSATSGKDCYCSASKCYCPGGH